MSGRMDRREFLAAGAAAAVSLAVGTGNAAPVRRPNVLLIFMDDMTYRAIGSLNNPEVQTPNIDRLVRRGTTFTHAFNQGAWSGAVCIPARAMLITGLTLWHARDRIEHTPLFGETLGKNGYTTFFTGKWHNSHPTLVRSYTHLGPVGPGFYASTPVDGDAYNRPAPGNTWSPSDRTRKGHWLDVEGAVVHSSQRWADAAVEFLKSDLAVGPQPFFLHVAFHGPHDPRQSPQEFLDKYPSHNITVPPNYLPEHPFDQGDNRGRDELLAPFPRTREAVQVHRQEYYAILSYTDQQIGRILDALDASGQADNTLVVFSGDHGLAVGQHGLMGKQNQYDHSVRVPLIFAGPGIPAGKQVDAPVYQNGIFPTVCDLVGVPAPAAVETHSLASLLRGNGAPPFDAIYGAYLELQRMVRTPEHKLIVYPKVHRVQLFNVQEDPWETRDLSTDPGNGTLIRDLWGRLHQLQKELDDPLDLPVFI